MSLDRAKLAHDLRSPLARAKTLAKLLLETRAETERAELQRMLLEALEELDAKIGELGS
jgi:hypothetical protein